MSDLHCPARLIVTGPGEAAYETDVGAGSGGTLTALGRAQARDLARGLSGERVAGVVCSELSRAVQTAEIAAAVLVLPVEVCGGLQGLAPGETDEDGAARALAVLDDVADRYRGETVLVVGHGGVIGAVVSRLSPGSSPELPDAPDAAGVATYVLERDADGWRVG